ncbi:hypothetical protein EYC80_009676 [Monilinia laxa]|uniref:Uncharacterized protein n=1 Tax=Monilinia laxa TaxID=61186 RepID=A0A5N6JYM2_MONLA|nr:hypothetical protein EYC80_009676 [Monilinia laxa]
MNDSNRFEYSSHYTFLCSGRVYTHICKRLCTAESLYTLIKWIFLHSPLFFGLRQLTHVKSLTFSCNIVHIDLATRLLPFIGVPATKY